jgi:hypothetical protein
MRQPRPSDSKAKRESMVADQPPGLPLALPADASEPVGTGVADGDDPFAEFAAPGAESSDTSSGPSSSRAGSAIRGVFRALFRANVPQIPLQGVMPPGMPGGPAPNLGDPGDGPAFGDQDFDFGDEPTEDDPFETSF